MIHASSNKPPSFRENRTDMNDLFSVKMEHSRIVITAIMSNGIPAAILVSYQYVGCMMELFRGINVCTETARAHQNKIPKT